MSVRTADRVKGRLSIPAAAAAAPGARTALALLLCINLFNYIDRQVLAAVEPEIRQALFPDDPEGAVAKVRMGLLADAFLVTYMVAAPLFGYLAARMSHWLLICFGVTLWSLASGASGWDWGPAIGLAYGMLFLTRCCVGVGEAAYGPVAPTVLARLYPVEKRGKMMALFYMAIPVGGALGYALGDAVAKSSLGWRWAFYMVVPPGLLLGLWSFLKWEPGAKDGGTGDEPARQLTRADYLRLFRTASFILNTLGMAAMTFAIGGLAFWIKDYLEFRKVAPVADIPPVTFFGLLTVVGGLLATLAGGWAGDKLRPRFSGSYFLVSGAAMLIGFPMILLMIWTPFPLAWVFLFLAVFCLFFNTGPSNTILANVARPEVRATGFAVNIFLIHILGDIPSPPLMGYIAGAYSRDMSFIIVSLMVLVGGLFWLWGSLYLERDTRLASE